MQAWLGSCASDKVCVYLFLSNLCTSVVNMLRILILFHESDTWLLHSGVIYHVVVSTMYDFVCLTTTCLRNCHRIMYY